MATNYAWVSAEADDRHYTDAKLTGSDAIVYRVPMAELDGKPAAVRATMQYQTVPPGYLAARFKDPYHTESSSFLPATERSIYLTSHLNTDLELTSTHPHNAGLKLSNAWTMSLHRATADVEDAVTVYPPPISASFNGFPEAW